jgi:hypothetical protein
LNNLNIYCPTAEKEEKKLFSLTKCHGWIPLVRVFLLHWNIFGTDGLHGKRIFCLSLVALHPHGSLKTKGLTREEIISVAQLSNGGSINRILVELELSGFIRRYRGYDKKIRQSLYQLVDFYTLFYFNFLKDNTFDEHYWTNFIENARHRA